MKEKSLRQQIFTVPNILTYVRFLLIPLIIWLYCGKQSPEWTAAVVILSGITDVVDGFIARRFDMITDLGKAMDPIADKLTQISVLFCLTTRFPMLLAPLGLMIVKELTSLSVRAVILKKTGQVQGAVWHGKLNTVVIHSVMLLHIVWYDIPSFVSWISVCVSMLIMSVSFALYSIENVYYLKKTVTKEKNNEKDRYEA